MFYYFFMLALMMIFQLTASVKMKMTNLTAYWELKNAVLHCASLPNLGARGGGLFGNHHLNQNIAPSVPPTERIPLHCGPPNSRQFSAIHHPSKCLQQAAPGLEGGSFVAFICKFRASKSP